MDETRRVNLNEKVRTVLDLEVADRTFRIVRVVTGVRQLYGELLSDSGRYLGRVAELQAAFEEVQSAGEEEQEKLAEQMEKLTREVDEFSVRKMDLIMRCLELLLEKNGYEFSREWWIDNTDEQDMRAFIIEALNKDVAPGAGSKKKE